MSRPLDQAAKRISTELLGPAASYVDRTGELPPGHFDALATAGIYGAVLDPDPTCLLGVIETLAEGCLATTFVWLQHHGLLGRLARLGAASPLPETLVGDLAAGRVRAGIVQAGLLPGPPLLTATAEAEGSWRLDGTSPWCTGWGMVDELLVAARLANDDEAVGWFMLGATDHPGLTTRRLRLQAVDATATVTLDFRGVSINRTRFLGSDAFDEVGHAAGHGLRPNGSLALGLSRRCVNELRATNRPQAAEAAELLAVSIDQVRSQLDSGSMDDMATARAAANRLAIQAATTLVAGTGAPSALTGSVAEQAMREATFLLVFGSRPQIRDALLR